MYCSKFAKTVMAFCLAVTFLFLASIIPDNAYADEDNTAPKATNIQISPIEIVKPGVVDVSFSLIENDTGLKHIVVFLTEVDSMKSGAPTSDGKNYIHFELDVPQALYSGMHTVSIPVPSTVVNGEWTISHFYLTDNAGNVSYYQVNDAINLKDDDELVLSNLGSDYQDGSYSEVIADPVFEINSEFDIAFQYGADNPNLVKALTNMSEGEAGEILVNLTSGYTIPAAAFSAIKGQNKYLIINGDGIEWIFYGKDILDECKAVDARTSVSNVSGSPYGIKDDIVQVVFADNGQLPGKAQIRLKSDYLYNKAGVKGTVYVYYKDKGKISLESSSKELVMDGSDKWCYFDIDHNSTFILSPDKLNENIKGAWIKKDGKWWYRYADGSYPKNGTQKIGSATYYFDTNGWMKTGWQKISNKWYYFKSSGAMATGWQKVKSKWYFMNAEGVMQTGKITDKGKTYFLDGNGAMKTGWVQQGSSWYYTNKSGAMTTGWQKVKGAWYYLNPADGKMKTGKLVIGGKTYFLKSSGAMKTGWNQEGSKWYYYDKSGAMKTNAWISGKYWVGSNGVMATKTWVDGDKYYVNAKGEWVKGAKR